MNDHTKPSPETRAAEREEAEARHDADRPPTAEEDAAAEDLEVDPDAVERYEEMAERGAKQKGEGRIP
jgi:hypothetical protein